MRKPVYSIGDSVVIDNDEVATVVAYYSSVDVILKTTKGEVKTTVKRIREQRVFIKPKKRLQSLVGTSIRNKNNELIKCISKSKNNMVVEFEDGKRVNTTYMRWINGNVFRDSISGTDTEGDGYRTDLALNKIKEGTKKVNRDGELMRVLNVRDDGKIDVLFQNSHIVKLGMDKCMFAQGRLTSSIGHAGKAVSYDLYKNLDKQLLDAIITGRMPIAIDKEESYAGKRVKVEDYERSGSPELTAKESLEKRLVKSNKDGLVIACVKYDSATSVDVWFKTKGIVKIGVSAQQFKQGTVTDKIRSTSKVMNIDDYMELNYPHVEEVIEECNDDAEGYTPVTELSKEAIKWMGVTRKLSYGIKAKIVWFRNKCDIDIAFTDSTNISQHSDIYTFVYGGIHSTDKGYVDKATVGLRRVVKSSELDNPRLLLTSYERIALRKLGVTYAVDITNLDEYDIKKIDSEQVDTNKINLLRECLTYKFSKENTK